MSPSVSPTRAWVEATLTTEEPESKSLAAPRVHRKEPKPTTTKTRFHNTTDI